MEIIVGGHRSKYGVRGRDVVKGKCVITEGSGKERTT
jgi:hypothetical protein